MALNTIINFRASDQEVKLLEALEKAYDTNKSEIMRMMIRREAEDRALEVIFLRRIDDQERLFELGELIAGVGGQGALEEQA